MNSLKTFWKNKVTLGEREFIALALRQQAQHMVEGEVGEAVLIEETEDQFLIQSGSRLYWGKVGFEPMSLVHAQRFVQAHSQLEVTLKKSLQALMFFPEMEEGVATFFKGHAAGARLFQYAYLKTGQKSALALNPCDVSDRHLAANPVPAPVRDYCFAREARLTRVEISDLLDLALTLKF